MPEVSQARVNAARRQVEENRLLGNSRSLLCYLRGLWKRAPLYAHWKRFSALLRSFRVVTVTVRVISVLFAILQTGALLILALAFLLALMLLGGLFMLVILLISSIRAVQSNRMLSRLAEDREICLLFMNEMPSTFFWENAKDLAARGFLVLVVSPFWLSARGHSKGRFYLTARKETAGLYLIRKYYLFRLRRRILHDKKAVYFY